MSDLTDDTDAPSRDDALADAIAALPANAEPAPEAPAEPVEPQPAPEASTQAPATPPAADEPGKVPLAALIAERQRRRDLEQRLAALEQQRQQPALQAPVAAQEPAKPALPTEPTVKYEDNPGEYLRQVTEIQARKAEAIEREMQERVRAYEAEVQRDQQHRQQAQQIQRLDYEYQRAWAEAAGLDEMTGQVARPEVFDAYKFFVDSVTKEAMASGYSRQQAQELLVQVERNEAYRAFTNDLNPADVIMARARTRGWTPGQAARTAAVQPQPAVAAPAPAPAPAADQPERAEKRAAATSKLSAASGNAPAPMSLREINQLTPQEYAKWRRKHGESGFEKLIGAA